LNLGTNYKIATNRSDTTCQSTIPVAVVSTNASKIAEKFFWVTIMDFIGCSIENSHSEECVLPSKLDLKYLGIMLDILTSQLMMNSDKAHAHTVHHASLALLIMMITTLLNNPVMKKSP